MRVARWLSVDAGAEEGEQGDPVAGVGDGEGADGGKEEVVEQDGGGDGSADGVAQAPVAGEDENQQQEGERDGGVVGPGEAAVRRLQFRQVREQ